MKDLKKSQNAHSRLMKKYSNSHNESDWILLNYHSGCFAEQKKKGRTLTDKEKKSIYDFVKLYYFK